MFTNKTFLMSDAYSITLINSCVIFANNCYIATCCSTAVILQRNIDIFSMIIKVMRREI